MYAYFMRHGETNYNRQALCNADPRINVYLTEQGKQQARDAAEKLRHIPLQHIYVSELPRTRQTADIVNTFHDIEISVCPELNDIDSGFEGRPVAEYFAAIGSMEQRLTRSVNGGESVLDYKKRLQPFFRWFNEIPHTHALVVAHEETLRIVNAHYCGLDDHAMMERVFKNCEIIAFDTDSKIEMLLQENS